jgi:hypothetical protein
MSTDAESAVERWEYLTFFVSADAERQREFLQQRWPDWKAPKHAPEAMIPELNAFGEEGWELVHMEPVFIDANYYIRWGSVVGYSSEYFCVFKRRKHS